MDPTVPTPPQPKSSEIISDHSPFLRIYADGHVERLFPLTTVPPSTDPTTGVTSSDCPHLPARLFLPPLPSPTSKLPVLLHFHGGAFCIGSAFGTLNTAYLYLLSSITHSLVVSVEYPLAPEHPLPSAYHHSLLALCLVATASTQQHPWLHSHADLTRLFLVGDSAGANIAHHVATRAAAEGVDLAGVVLCHPFFWGEDAVDGETTDEEVSAEVGRNWRMACPGTSGCDDPWINPRVERKGPACRRVLVCVAERDVFRWRGRDYYEMLGGGGWWDGVAEMLESEGEEHAFHVMNPRSDKAREIMDRIAVFVNR